MDGLMDGLLHELMDGWINPSIDPSINQSMFNTTLAPYNHSPFLSVRLYQQCRSEVTPCGPQDSYHGPSRYYLVLPGTE